MISNNLANTETLCCTDASSEETNSSTMRDRPDEATDACVVADTPTTDVPYKGRCNVLSKTNLFSISFDC